MSLILLVLSVLRNLPYLKSTQLSLCKPLGGANGRKQASGQEKLWGLFEEATFPDKWLNFSYKPLSLKCTAHHFMANWWGNSGKCQILVFWAPKSLQMVTAAVKLKDAYSLEGKLWPPCFGAFQHGFRVLFWKKRCDICLNRTSCYS